MAKTPNPVLLAKRRVAEAALKMTEELPTMKTDEDVIKDGDKALDAQLLVSMERLPGRLKAAIREEVNPLLDRIEGNQTDTVNRTAEKVINAMPAQQKTAAAQVNLKWVYLGMVVIIVLLLLDLTVRR